LISLIDKETQYFVAESTKTLSLDDSTMHEDPDDAVWAGVSYLSESFTRAVLILCRCSVSMSRKQAAYVK
jgi:hypothetical protein